MTYVSAINGLNTALRGLLAQQRSLDVTGHNIANVNTEGYSRQEAVLGTAPSLQLLNGALLNGSGAELGQGVDVQTYRRMRDDFLDLQWRAQNMASGQADVTAQRLGQAESVLGEGSDTGLGTLLNKFWSAWSDLASNPESPSARTAVVGAAQNLAGGFNALDTSLAAMQSQATQGATDLMSASGPVQPIADELAKLNVAINQSVQAGRQPNDLLDRRDLLLDKLSAYGQVSITADATYPAMYNVSFAGDTTTLLVNQGTAAAASSLTPSATPGGQLQGLLSAATTLGNYRTTLDGFASSIITNVNAAHGSTIFGGTDAATISVTPPVTINAGSSGAAGANDVALAIAAMRGGTVDTGWANFVTQVGSDVASAQSQQATQARVLDSLTAQRQSTSGVSLDEEMTNMVRFQRGYQASARAMTTMDEALDILINRTGKVGL
jgi:flagellar hook-associated protein 1 FlgK